MKKALYDRIHRVWVALSRGSSLAALCWLLPAPASSTTLQRQQDHQEEIELIRSCELLTTTVPVIQKHHLAGDRENVSEAVRSALVEVADDIGVEFEPMPADQILRDYCYGMDDLAWQFTSENPEATLHHDGLAESVLLRTCRNLDPYSAFVLGITKDDVFSSRSFTVVRPEGRWGYLEAAWVAPGSPYAPQMRRGDLVMKVDGTSTAGLTDDEFDTYFACDTDPAVEAISPHCGRPSLLVMRERDVDGRKRAEFISIDPPPRRGDTLAMSLDPDTGIATVAVHSMVDESIPADVERFLSESREAGMAGVILDLRGNTGGLVSVAVGLAELFVGTPGSPVVHYRCRSGCSSSGQRTSFFCGGFADLPMLVMVDASTASAAELLTAALQDYGRAVVVGTRTRRGGRAYTTHGKGTFAQVYEVDTGDMAGILLLTVGQYFRPSGEQVHCAGIVPDVVLDEILDGDVGDGDLGDDAPDDERPSFAAELRNALSAMDLPVRAPDTVVLQRAPADQIEILAGMAENDFVAPWHAMQRAQEERTRDLMVVWIEMSRETDAEVDAATPEKKRRGRR